MPTKFIANKLHSLTSLCLDAVSLQEGGTSCDKNLKFLLESLKDQSTPDFHGYNHQEIHLESAQQGNKLPIQKRVSTRSLPLIDSSPTDPSTILTAMVEAERQTQSRGQKYTVFTVDQQLFAIVLNIIWSDPKQWELFIPRLGGMHLVMSFIGCIGTLMAGSGLKEVMKSAFAGVEKMLLGKKFPSNIRALRMVLIELLRNNLPQIRSYNEFESWLNELVQKSKLACHWVDNFIKPVLIALTYIQAE